MTIGEQVFWSVPVVFGLPGAGLVGRAGVMQVDAATGELLTDLKIEQEIMDYAAQLARPAALPAGV